MDALAIIISGKIIKIAYDPELVKQLLGDSVAELFDGTVKIIPSDGSVYDNLKVGDILEFKFKETTPFIARQFVVTGNK